ncbi:MAG: cob(I)yrinic acid a,c-diamide adenosyltransferase [Acidimicrobiales bacterium]
MTGHLWTGRGDDGTTGLYFGGRVAKDAAEPEALGSVDEAQAALGVARAEADPASPLHAVLTEVCGHLYVVMAELATAPANAAKLEDGRSRVTAAMVALVEARTDEAATRFPPLTDFVIPGQDRLAALLDVARTLARRAERRAVPIAVPGSSVVPYLNRLSSLLWALARAEEAGEGGAVLAKDL